MRVGGVVYTLNGQSDGLVLLGGELVSLEEMVFRAIEAERIVFGQSRYDTHQSNKLFALEGKFRAAQLEAESWHDALKVRPPSPPTIDEGFSDLGSVIFNEARFQEWFARLTEDTSAKGKRAAARPLSVRRRVDALHAASLKAGNDPTYEESARIVYMQTSWGVRPHKCADHGGRMVHPRPLW